MVTARPPRPDPKLKRDATWLATGSVLFGDNGAIYKVVQCGKSRRLVQFQEIDLTTGDLSAIAESFVRLTEFDPPRPTAPARSFAVI
jgi:hypothetical protein